MKWTAGRSRQLTYYTRRPALIDQILTGHRTMFCTRPVLVIGIDAELLGNDVWKLVIYFVRDPGPFVEFDLRNREESPGRMKCRASFRTNAGPRSVAVESPDVVEFDADALGLYATSPA